MSKLALPLLALVALSAGCAAAPLAPTTPAEKPAAVAADASADEATPTEEANASTSNDRRVVGDYVTFAFSGKYRKSPLQLTQRVVSRSKDTITVEYTFAEKGQTETLRATTATTGENAGRTLEVLRLSADGTTAAVAQEAFEARIGETAPATDMNEGVLTERQTTVRVAGEDLTATTTVFKVRIGKEAATLEATTSEAFAWGDLGGKVTTADGKVYFSAELVDAGGPVGARASLDGASTTAD